MAFTRVSPLKTKITHTYPISKKQKLMLDTRFEDNIQHDYYAEYTLQATAIGGCFVRYRFVYSRKDRKYISIRSKKVLTSWQQIHIAKYSGNIKDGRELTITFEIKQAIQREYHLIREYLYEQVSTIYARRNFCLCVLASLACCAGCVLL